MIRRQNRAIVQTGGLLLCLTAAACGGPGADTNTPQQTCETNPTGPGCVTTGSINVTVSGVPNDVPAPQIGLYSLPDSQFAGSIAGSGVFANLQPKSYYLSAAATSNGPTVRYFPSSTPVVVTVSRGGVASASIAYTATLYGAIQFSVQGVPASPTVNFTYQGPTSTGSQALVNGTNVVPYLQPGTWSVTLPLAGTFIPQPATFQVQVTTGAVAQGGPISYTQTGTLQVNVSGLPQGVNAAGSITGPNGFNQPLTGSQSFVVNPGVYTVTPTQVTSSGTSYGAQAQSGTVTAGQTTTVTVTYGQGPLIVLKTTAPIVVADRLQTTIIGDYAIQNGGGGTLTAAVSPAAPASWLQLAVIGGNTLRLTIDATGLLPFSEAKTPYVTQATVSAPGAAAVPITIKYAKTFDAPAGMAATVIRFHRFSGLPPTDPTPPNISAVVDLIDRRTGARIPAEIISPINPTNPNWLLPPSTNALGQLVLNVQPYTDPPNPVGNIPNASDPLGSPVQIKLRRSGSNTTCTGTVPPNPECQVFVYYDSDSYPRLLLRPWGVQLTPASPTQSAAIERQGLGPHTINTPALHSHSCGNKLAQNPTVTATQVTVTGNFASLADDEDFRCFVKLRATYVDIQTGVAALDTMAVLDVRLAKPSGNGITPSVDNLNLVATAGATALPAEVIALTNLGPGLLNPIAASLSNGTCPAGLLSGPVLSGASLGQGVTRTVSITLNPQGRPALTCSASIDFSANSGSYQRSLPVTVRLK